MRIKNAVYNFISFLESYSLYPKNRIPKITFVCDFLHSKLVDDILAIYQKHNVIAKKLLVLDYNCITKNEDLLNTSDIVLLFYENGSVEASTPEGNLVYIPLISFLEKDLAENSTTKFISLYDTAAIFKELYAYPLEYYTQSV